MAFHSTQVLFLSFPAAPRYLRTWVPASLGTSTNLSLFLNTNRNTFFLIFISFSCVLLIYRSQLIHNIILRNSILLDATVCSVKYFFTLHCSIVRKLQAFLITWSISDQYLILLNFSEDLTAKQISGSYLFHNAFNSWAIALHTKCMRMNTKLGITFSRSMFNTFRCILVCDYCVVQFDFL